MKKGSSGDPDFGGSLVRSRPSVTRRVVAILAPTFLVIWGFMAAWWLCLSSCLPEYATMTSETTDRGNVTVARRLVELGAYAWRGKIYDRSGREVIFEEVGRVGGAQPGGQILRQAQERMDAIRVHHPVIEVRHHRSEGEVEPQ